MANKIQVKRSAVAGKVPTTADIDLGEIAINTNDGKMYIKKDNGTASIIQVGSGAGDVVGPASATDNAIVRFDGTTGKLVQNSIGLLDDSGNLDVASAKADYFDLDTAAASPADAVGREAWDDGAGAPIVGLKGGVVTYYYGQQEFARVYNGSGAAMTKGQVVYIVGAQGNRVDVRLAQANAESTSANTIGLVAEPIAADAEGWVQTTGPLPKISTTGLTAGAPIYLSPTTAGAYTTSKPSAPNHLVVLGFIERVDATVGSIYLKVDNGYELDELHNVNTTAPTGGQLLAYDQTAGYWKNITLTDGTGVSITETSAGAVTVNLAANYGDTLNPYASKTAKYFLAAPNAAAGAPTFRAIVASDIPTLNQSTTGSAATLTTARTINEVSFNGSANITVPRVKSFDDRTTAPIDASAGYATFAFSSWANNNTVPYADSWIMRSYTDASGGNDNMVSFRKDAIGMRIWQQTYGSATAFATYKDVAWTDGTNASGTWAINTSGSAATLTTARTINGTSFNGSANITTANWGTARTLSYTGDVTGSSSVNGSANVATAITLANSGVTAGTYMSPKVTVDAKGRITSAATVTMESSDNFLTITQTATGWNFAQYVPPPPDWFVLQSSTLSNLSTTIAMPTGFTTSPSGTAQMILAGSTNGFSFGSSLSPGTWSNTFNSGGWSTFQTPSGYVSNSFSSIANPSTIYPSAPTSGVNFVYMVYPNRNTVNTTLTTFLGSSTSSWGSGFGSSAFISGPSPSGSSRRLYAVLVVTSSSIGTVTSSLSGAVVTTTTDSFTNTTTIFVSVTNNSSVSSALTGTAVVQWANSNSYYGSIWIEHQ